MAITGAGTETDPYLVSTAEELRACLESNDSGDYPGQYIQLANDIDKVGDKLSSTTITSPKHLNGNNHKIRNIYVDQRLFYINNVQITFKNIHFENIDVVANSVKGVLIYAYVSPSPVNINIHTCTFHVHLAELHEYNTMFHFEAEKGVNDTMLFEKCEFMFFINEKSNTVADAEFVGFTCTARNWSPNVNIGIKQSRIVFDYSNYLTTQPSMDRITLFYRMLHSSRWGSQTAQFEQSYVMIKGNDKDYSLCGDRRLMFTENKELYLKYVYFFADDKVKSSLLSYDYSGMSTDITQRNYAIQVLVSTPLTQNQEESGSQGVYYLTYDQIKNPDYLNSIYWYVNKEGE